MKIQGQSNIQGATLTNIDPIAKVGALVHNGVSYNFTYEGDCQFNLLEKISVGEDGSVYADGGQPKVSTESLAKTSHGAAFDKAAF